MMVGKEFAGTDVKMIVDPDFCDHWKTRMLVGLLGGDEAAPVYVLRLWAHCQNRRDSSHKLTPDALRAICHFTGDPNALDAAMSASGFISRDGEVVRVMNWDEKNAALIASWRNGAKGGRGRPSEPRGKPTGSGVEKRREEEITPVGSNPPTQSELQVLGYSPLNPPKGDVCGKAKPKQEYPRSFEEWYFAYPRHTKKEAALKAYKAAGKRLKEKRGWTSQAAAAYLLERALLFARSIKGQGPYCPYPASWLNAGQYDDDPNDWNRSEPNQPSVVAQGSGETASQKARRLFTAKEEP